MPNKSFVRALPYAGQIKLRGIILPIVPISVKTEDYHHGNKAPRHKRVFPCCPSLYGLTQEVEQRSATPTTDFFHPEASFSPAKLTHPPGTDGSTFSMGPWAFSQDSGLELSPPVTGRQFYAHQDYSLAGCELRCAVTKVAENIEQKKCWVKCLEPGT